jgi:hypothetical protein
MAETGTSLIPLETIQRLDTVLATYKSIEVVTIQSPEQAGNAKELYNSIAQNIKDFEAERVRIKEPFLQSGKDVDAWFKERSKILLDLKSKLDVSLRAYNQLLENQRRIAQEKLNAEAAERIRKANEKAATDRAEAERLRKEAEQATEAEAAKLRAQAAKKEERADTREMNAQTIVAPVAQSAAPTLKTRTNWKCDITDAKAFVQFAIKTKRFELLQPNETAANAMAKMIRDPYVGEGYRIYNDERVM